MPNHVTHRVMITGPAEKIAAFKAAFMKEAADYDGDLVPCLDFNTITPMPEILTRTGSGGTKIDGQMVTTWIEDKDAEGKRVNRLPTPEEEAELAAIGHSNWYDWSVSNWGTKWNAYDCTWDQPDEGCAQLKFDTAWSPPEPIFEALAARPECKELLIEIDAFDEGWNFGFQGKIEDGTYEGATCDATNDLYEQVYGYPYEEDEYDDDDEDEDTAEDSAA
jgi:hypothetical protein